MKVSHGVVASQEVALQARFPVLPSNTLASTPQASSPPTTIPDNGRSPEVVELAGQVLAALQLHLRDSSAAGSAVEVLFRHLDLVPGGWAQGSAYLKVGRGGAQHGGCIGCSWYHIV